MRRDVVCVKGILKNFMAELTQASKRIHRPKPAVGDLEKREKGERRLLKSIEPESNRWLSEVEARDVGRIFSPGDVPMPEFTL
jgi:hypothetical protein